MDFSLGIVVGLIVGSIAIAMRWYANKAEQKEAKAALSDKSNDVFTIRVLTDKNIALEASLNECLDSQS